MPVFKDDRVTLAIEHRYGTELPIHATERVISLRGATVAPGTTFGVARTSQDRDQQLKRLYNLLGTELPIHAAQRVISLRGTTVTPGKTFGVARTNQGRTRSTHIGDSCTSQYLPNGSLLHSKPLFHPEEVPTPQTIHTDFLRHLGLTHGSNAQSARRSSRMGPMRCPSNSTWLEASVKVRTL